MMHYRLWDELDRVISRYRHLMFWWTLSAGWLAAAVLVFCAWWFGLASGWGQRELLTLTLFAAASLIAVCSWRTIRRSPTPLWVARQIEGLFPDLRSSLLAAIEQRPELPNGRFGFMQAGVIKVAVDHARRHTWSDVVPGRRIALAAITQFGTLGLFLLALVAVTFWEPPHSSFAAVSEKRTALTFGNCEFTVEPGDAEIELGTSFLVLARIRGDMPPEAILKYGKSDGDETRMDMSRSLDDPLFGGRISSITQPLAYHVEIGDLRSPTYRVEVFEYPRLERADAQLVYPSYTEMPEKLVQDVTSVSVVEGTEVTLLCYLNKKVAAAQLTEKNESNLELKPTSGNESVYEVTIRAEKSRRLKLELVDDRGRKNVQQSEFVVQVVRNQPPNLKPLFPSRDVEVSPIEELETRAVAFDDFGLKRFGVNYSLAGQEPVDKVLVENGAAREKHEQTHVLSLESLKAEPDQLLSYFFWAEDTAADGSTRRTEGDMYFAEVRPFEEIFREGQTPPGGAGAQQQGQQGESQNARDAESIAKLQKEIINATWKVIRREITDQLTDKFVSDAEQLYLSQANVQQQANALGDNLEDRGSQEHLVTALEAMKEAVAHLKNAHETASSAPLRPAMAAEQAAYQALLKLRAREHQIVRQRQRSQSSSSSGRSQQQQRQFQQLDLKPEENPYQEQRTAQNMEENPQDRENRQLLNRLRELARRQHDLNDRLTEMQTALQEAQTEEQRQDIRNQLKRLQEEQRQILRDTDELQTRMESPKNLEQMNQERQQLEEAREDARRASEALDQNKPTLASAAGTRAEKGFEELRNEFRRRAANRFTEDARQLRDAARQLDEKERDIARQLKEPQEPTGQKSLRDTVDREQIGDQVREQKQRLSQITERMRQTILDAEESEPLLSERLYDVARTLQQQKTEQALSATEQSLRQGLMNDARKLEEIAGQGIQNFRDGIEKAADAVLGDETEALRRARDELKRLSDELNQEIARNRPADRDTDNRQSQQGQQGQQGQQQGQQGQQQGQQGQQQDQQGQQGQQSQSNQRGGRAQAGQPGQQNRIGDRATVERQQLGGAGGGVGPFDGYIPRDFAPIAGEHFRDWSDRLRDVEEMVTDPDLRADVARIRDQARSIRTENRRHSAPPNWDLVQMQVAAPLTEIRDRVVQELLRRSTKQAVVPLDRDPVPPKFSEPTRRYYEHLGSGKQ